MKYHGFSNVDGDGVTFIKIENQRDGTIDKLIVGMHVDDGIVCASSKEVYEKLVADLQKDFVLRLHGELRGYLGCKIVQDLLKGTVTINQERMLMMYCVDSTCREPSQFSTWAWITPQRGKFFLSQVGVNEASFIKTGCPSRLSSLLLVGAFEKACRGSKRKNTNILFTQLLKRAIQKT
jgi:hypothetical protein